MRILGKTLLAGVLAAAVVGCGDDGGAGNAGSGGSVGGSGGSSGAGGTGGTLEVPATYSFERAGEPTVAHDGQTTRQVVMLDLIGSMRSISDDVLGGINLEDYDTPAEVYALLIPLVDDGGSADPDAAIPSLVDDPDVTLQTTYADLGGANLRDKIAGNDDVTDHADWDGDADDEDPMTNVDPAFVGWDSDNLLVDGAGTVGGASTPIELLEGFLWTFANQAAAGAINNFPIDNTTPLYLTPAGHDLVQLVQKFLLGAINFSQGTDDYTDGDTDGKGILATNELDDDNSYTTLEHQWDEGYGYWGAAADYSAYTDDDIADVGYSDTNDDGMIDLTSEYNFSASVNAAKRDRGSDASAPTDFTAQADAAWRTGRALITSAFDAGEAVDMAALIAQRDAAVDAWEKAIAATAIHYVNEVLADMQTIDDGGYDFEDHAKHWSELKGFALSFQFNPQSPITDAQFQQLHDWIEDAPVGASATAPSNDSGYRQALENARTLMGNAYGFDETNVLGW